MSTNSIYKKTLTAVSATVFLFLSTSIQAMPLGLNLGFPDVTSGAIETIYDASKREFTAIGVAVAFNNPPNTPVDVWDGVFDLKATIDNSGKLLSGTVSVTGRRENMANPLETLVEGNLTDFGYQTGGPFEFLFDVTGGCLTCFDPLLPGGILLDAKSNFAGSFTNDFDGKGGVSDTAPIPVPAAVWLLGTGIFGLLTASRRKHTLA